MSLYYIVVSCASEDIGNKERTKIMEMHGG